MKDRVEILTEQQNSLRSQLDEALRKSCSFEGELLRTTTDSQVSQQILQDSFSALKTELASKEDNFQAVKETLSSIQKQLGRKEAECQDLQNNLHEIQGELRRNETERQDLQDNLSSLQDKATENEEAQQNLQDSLSTIQNRLTGKEEEYRALSRELEESNNIRENLESGKSKAKSEIHALLKRVQEAESAAKLIRETLHRMNIAQLDQPLPEIMDQLEKSFQAANSSQMAIVGEIASQVRTPETSARVVNLRTNVNSGNQEVHTDSEENEPKTPINHYDEPLPLKQGGEIVPFSSIAVSPTHCAVADGEPFDFSCMLMQTPERSSVQQELRVPPRPEKEAPPIEIISRERSQSTDLILGVRRVLSAQGPTKVRTQDQHLGIPIDQAHLQPKDPVPTRKVSFVAGNTAAETDSVQVPDSQEKNIQSNLLESSLNGDSLTRTNRWTYSKRQRETSTKRQDAATSEKSYSQSEVQQAHNNKKVKTFAEPFATGSQGRAGPELHDRRKSPTRLASGSSRASLDLPVIEQKPRRRSGRKTRGKRHGF
ncbi:hypothetical protein ASPVEDRAFT_788860 [Aspergillus versicolor CBS 583.65]|uniref:Uncharacterized protein n=1 Tax=Aspergillus versicolor CBS 583.65 TaxID=1036611 RepID=A0A1L9PSJ6_ASPVE|nr:uncharacterized protein ASPVEDRAFT_788860 [Aspergillus versicolor CBS 583.65]OJJ04432.1 hypothetical protein ASPVEDRAFT_788860 [Aspergillus versicolor CBS 583.65]